MLGRALGYLAHMKPSAGLVSGAGGGNLLVRGGWCLLKNYIQTQQLSGARGSTAVTVRCLHPPSKDHCLTGLHIFPA